jgi:large repetitive protein
LDYSHVTVLLGSGNGSFNSQGTHSTGVTYRYPWEAEVGLPIAVADLNGDAKPDVVVGGSYNLYNILLGNGNGTLQSPRQLGTSGPTIAVADFNVDGKLDLAGGGYGSAVQAMLGNGLGEFGNPTIVPAGTGTLSVSTADVNVDGRPDLVAFDGQSVKVLLGQTGTGLQFTPPITAATGVSWVATLSKDFNGDGRPDWAAVDPGSDRVSVLLNDGTWLNVSAPALQINDVTVTEGHTGTRNATFTVTLSASYSQDVTFDYATTDGFGPNDPATAGIDYVAQSGRLTIPAGQTTAVIQVPVIGDRLGERAEHFSVNLSNPNNAFVIDGQGLATILDDEPIIDFWGAIEITEGNTGAKAVDFVVRLSVASDQEVRVNYSTAEGDTQWSGGWYYGYYPPPAATAGSDFQSVAGTLVFAPGEIEKTIRVLVNGDREAEQAEAFSVDLSGPVGVRISSGHGVVTILDDEPRAFLEHATVVEGTGGTTLAQLVVKLTEPSDAPISVNYATRDWGSAVAGVDFESTTGSVTFAPGETAKSIFVTIYGDSLAEYRESVPVELTGATGAHASSVAYVEIVDDDAQIRINDVSRAEGNSGTTGFTFTVTMSSPVAENVIVSYETVAWWQAEADSDFAAKSGTLVFAPGETSKTITIAVYGDTRREDDESFYVHINVESGNAIAADWEGRGTILNDDTLTTILISNAQIVEGNSGTRLMTFTVSLTQASTKEVRVNYGTVNGTARTSNNDYVSASGTLSFAPGQTIKTITVKVTGDKNVESDEFFYVRLSGARNGEIGIGEGIGTILNDDVLQDLLLGRGRSRR